MPLLPLFEPALAFAFGLGPAFELAGSVFLAERLPLAGEPTAEDILAVDAEFRMRLAEQGSDPVRRQWLAPFRKECGGWRFRARLSRTALAGRKGKTDDWVEILYEDAYGSGQRLVVTETRGIIASAAVWVRKSRPRSSRREVSGSNWPL